MSRVLPKPGRQIEGALASTSTAQCLTNMHTKHQGRDYEGSYPERADKHGHDWMAI